MASMWSIPWNVSCALEKNIRTSAFGWKVLYISIKVLASKVLFQVNISLLVFCPLM